MVLRYLTTISWFVLLILAQPSKAIGDELVVSTMNFDFPPYQTIRDGVPTGPDSDIITEVFKRITGRPPRFELLPVGRIYEGLCKGELLATVGFRDEEYAFTALYSKYPLHVSDYRLATLKSDKKFDSVQTFYGGTIGIAENHLLTKDLKNIFADKVSYLAVPDVRSQLRMLKNGRVDAVFHNVDILKYHARDMGMLDRLNLQTPKLLPEAPFYLVLARRNSAVDTVELQEKIDGAMTAMRNDGTWLAILRHYYGEDTQLQ